MGKQGAGGQEAGSGPRERVPGGRCVGASAPGVVGRGQARVECSRRRWGYGQGRRGAAASRLGPGLLRVFWMVRGRSTRFRWEHRASCASAALVISCGGGVVECPPAWSKLTVLNRQQPKGRHVMLSSTRVHNLFTFEGLVTALSPLPRARTRASRARATGRLRAIDGQNDSLMASLRLDALALDLHAGLQPILESQPADPLLHLLQQ